MRVQILPRIAERVAPRLRLPCRLLVTTDGVRLKLIRAEEHLRSLDTEIGKYLNSEPFKFIKKLQGKELCLVLDIREQPPFYLSTIIGDFPIFIEEGPYRNALNQNGLPRCISEKALALIESVQPCQAGENGHWKALWFIHELSNRDKHVTLHTTIGRAYNEAIRIEDAVRGKTSTEISPRMLDHGAELVRIPVATLGESTMNVKARFAGFIALQEPEPWTDDAILTYLAKSLDFLKSRLVPAFENLFSS